MKNGLGPVNIIVLGRNPLGTSVSTIKQQFYLSFFFLLLDLGFVEAGQVADVHFAAWSRSCWSKKHPIPLHFLPPKKTYETHGMVNGPRVPSKRDIVSNLIIIYNGIIIYVSWL